MALKTKVRPHPRPPVVEWVVALEARRLLATVAGTVFNDYDADGLIDPREPALPGRTVYIDANNNGQLDPPSPRQDFGSADTPAAVPDGFSFIESTISIPPTQPGLVADLNINLTIVPAVNGELTVTLFSPSGQSLLLFSGVGSSGMGMDITLDDEAALLIFSLPPNGAPATGSYRPFSTLTVFDGESIAGDWKLRVQDSLAGNPATLAAWSVGIQAGDPQTIANASGLFVFESLSPGIYPIRQVVPNGWMQTFPAGNGAQVLDVTSPDQLTLNMNFGARQPPGTVAGTVFGDHDSDGVHDVGEPGLAGWTVYLDFDNDLVLDPDEDRAITAADGSFTITDVPPGNFTIRQILKPGWTPTAPSAPGAARPSAGSAVQAFTRTYSSESVVSRVDNLRGLRELDRYLIANPKAPLAGMVDLQRSAQMFKLHGDSLVEVRLRAGVDPNLVVAELDRLQVVEWASLNYQYNPAAGDPRDLNPNDPQYGSQYHHALQQTNLAWDTTLGDPRVIIAVTDDGLAMGHPDLYHSVWVNRAEIPATRLVNLTDINGDGYLSMAELNDPVNVGPFKANDTNSDGRIDAFDLLAAMGTQAGQDDGTGGWADGIDSGLNGGAGNGRVDDLVGYDFWQNDNLPIPQSGSDDHGTHVAGIATAGTNNGVGVSGIAGGATVMPIRFWGSPGTGWTSTIVSNAYAYAVNNGAKIITTSYTVDQFVNDPTFEAALQYIHANGALHFNSAGNANQQNPARQKYDQTLYVANTTSADLKFAGSNYGWGIDLSAPGTSIFSTSLLNLSVTSHGYENKTGTSMSAPNAAAAAALIWSVHPGWTRDQVAAQLIGSADNIDALNPQFAGQLGSGRVNPFRAVTETLAPPRFRGLAIAGNIVGTSLTQLSLDTRNVLDGSTVSGSAFSLSFAGADGEFGTTDDVAIPLDLQTTVMVGTNRLSFNLGATLLPGKYRFAASATIADPFGQPLDGNGDGVGGDGFTQHFTVEYGYAASIVPAETVTGVLFGNRDIIRPLSTDAAFAFETSQGIEFGFSEDVSGSVTPDILLLQNLTTGQTIASSDLQVTYDAVNHRARFVYTAAPGGTLPDGRYRATIAAGEILDRYGNPSAGEIAFDFFVLAGDADRSQGVDVDDFAILALNFNAAGTFSDGDFDYSGTVDIDDFSILALNFNQALPAAAGIGGGIAPAGRVSSPFAAAPVAATVAQDVLEAGDAGGGAA